MIRVKFRIRVNTSDRVIAGFLSAVWSRIRFRERLRPRFIFSVRLKFSFRVMVSVSITVMTRCGVRFIF